MIERAVPLDEVELRPLGAGEAVVVNDAFNEIFHTERSLEEWRWKFLGRERAPIMLAWHGDELLAQYAGVPARFQIDGVVWRAAQIVDVFSTPAARRLFGRRGVWVRTAEAFFDRFGRGGDTPLLFGFPSRRALRLGVLQLGYDAIEPEPIGYLRRVERGRSPLRRLGYRAELVAADDPRLDRLWARVAGRYPVAQVRDAAHVGSRFGGRPGVAYHRFLIRPRLGRAAVAFVVYRTDGDSVRWVDLVWDDGHPGALELAALISAKLAAGRPEELWLHNEPQGRAVLEAVGFESGPEPNDLVFVARAFAPEIDLSRVAGRVYLTMADADLV